MDPERGARWSQWMAAAQRGDAAAYARLLEDLTGPLRGYVRGRLGGAAAAEDVVQEILLSVHRARHTWRPERPFPPWLWAIARHAVVDALRRRARRVAREELREPTDAELSAAGAARAADGVADAALSDELAAALAELPDGQREALELIYLRGLSAAEAAAEVGTTHEAFRARVHRGYVALRARLRREGPET